MPYYHLSISLLITRNVKKARRSCRRIIEVPRKFLEDKSDIKLKNILYLIHWCSYITDTQSAGEKQKHKKCPKGSVCDKKKIPTPNKDKKKKPNSMLWYNMQDLRWTTHFFLLIQLTAYAKSQCPEIFRYTRNDTTEELMGIVEIQTPPQGVPLHLCVILSAATVLPTMYVGHIELAKSREESVRAVVRGFPLFYKIYFPVKNPIPVVTSITLNDDLYCRGPSAVGEVVTQMILEHTLYPPRVILPLTEHLLNLISKSNTTVSTSTTSNNFSSMEKTTIDPVHYQTKDHFRKKPDDSSCGIIAEQDSSSLGEKTQSNLRWPWLSAIFMMEEDMKFRCAGNLVTNQHVITVAHCLIEDANEIPPDSLLVSLGRSNLNDWEGTDSLDVRVLEYNVHPDFREFKSIGADLAVIKFAKRITYTPNIRPVCLWMDRSKTDHNIENRGFIVGWNNDEKINQSATEPHLISTSIIPKAECQDTNFLFNRLVNSNKTLCARSEEVGISQSGNDGSGLIMFHSEYNRYHMRGLFLKSLINISGRPNNGKHSIFVDVAEHLGWIYDKIMS
ncbi:hypothetical protein QAD02_012366 [Eretmocerus hayati]|uniref:Uncharacterized protein n=1 Tax=Eretmocerus hayati TaxID=131215 RepID=A0ACC2P228_9HYME|nr:hypothetical protein QAD02_012366 [Eretmocerus hayati]